jgi:hypothetical protein
MGVISPALRSRLRAELALWVVTLRSCAHCVGRSDVIMLRPFESGAAFDSAGMASEPAVFTSALSGIGVFESLLDYAGIGLGPPSSATVALSRRISAEEVADTASDPERAPNQCHGKGSLCEGAANVSVQAASQPM